MPKYTLEQLKRLTAEQINGDWESVRHSLEQIGKPGEEDNDDGQQQKS